MKKKNSEEILKAAMDLRASEVLVSLGEKVAEKLVELKKDLENSNAVLTADPEKFVKFSLKGSLHFSEMIRFFSALKGSIEGFQEAKDSEENVYKYFLFNLQRVLSKYFISNSPANSEAAAADKLSALEQARFLFWCCNRLRTEGLHKGFEKALW